MLISFGDTPDAGGPEPNLAADLGDKTGAGGAKPSIADDDEVVLTFLGDKTGAGGGDPNQARAVAEAKQAQFAAAMAQGDAEMAQLVRKQQELLAGHRRQQRILDGIGSPPGVGGAAMAPPGLSPSQGAVNLAPVVLSPDVGRLTAAPGADARCDRSI